MRKADTETSAAAETSVPVANPEYPQPTAGAQAASGEIGAERFELIQLAAYHDDCLHWAAAVSRWVNLATLLLGTSAFAAFVSDQAFAGQLSALAVATTGALALVFDFAGQARTHLELKRRAYQILADLECGSITLPEARSRRTLIFADEPPERSAVIALAGNRAGRAVYGDEFQPVRVNWLQRRFRHFLAFRGSKFPVEKRRT